MSKDRWYAYYKHASSGYKASLVHEPIKADSHWLSPFDTKQEASEEFKKGLNGHVNYIIQIFKHLLNNKTIEKRLKKYSSEGLYKYKELQQIVQSIKRI